MNVNMVEFTEVNARSFVAIYNDAITGGRESFTFEGLEYVTAFAYFVIQYLLLHKVVAGTFDDKRIFCIESVNPNLN